jgi:hypothetical protein
MAQIEIPKPWRERVCAILATEDTGGLIRWTGDAERRYQAIPGCPWAYEVYQPLKDFLCQPHATGCPVTLDSPAGETYEFFFPFSGQNLYGKMLLRTDGKSLVIFSAHVPAKANLSCE